jgi:hypothetical protein
MLKEDFVIQSQIRRILVRSNVDYSKMNFGTVKGVVYLRGVYQLSRVYVQNEDEKKDEESKIREFTIKTLSSLETKIRSVPGVSEIIFQFLNWKKERGHWIPIEAKKKEGVEDEEKKDPDRSEDTKGG